MHIFLSYATEDRLLAEEIQLALLGVGHIVFFDKTSLPAGADYHSRIEAAVRRSDLFIFLISPNSVAQGSYALTELKFARLKWSHPKERVLPVRLHGTTWEAIPPYLKSVTVLDPEGNVPAEIVAAIAAIQLRETSTASTNQEVPPAAPKRAHDGPSRTGSHTVQIWVAVISLISAIGVALISNWDGLFHKSPTADTVPLSNGMRGADTGSAQSPTLNVDCPETTEYDYSKVPPESKIVKKCPPP